MQHQTLTRRTFIKDAGVLAAPILLAAHAPPLVAAAPSPVRTLKVLCVGGHPDDPESGCGGTLSRYAELGHSVTVLYLTRGERGIRDKALEEAAKIRAASRARCVHHILVFEGDNWTANARPRLQISSVQENGREARPHVLFLATATGAKTKA